jgi:hypothetical protein
MEKTKIQLIKEIQTRFRQKKIKAEFHEINSLKRCDLRMLHIFLELLK